MTQRDRKAALVGASEPTAQTWEEIGFAEFPIVAASKKRPPVNTIEFHERVGTDPKNGEAIFRDWKMVGSDDYGLPYLPDLDLFVAILQLAERHDYQEKLLKTTAKELCDLSGVRAGGTTYQRFRDGLFRFKFSGYAADRVFYHPGSKEPIIGEAWSIISTFRLLPHNQDPAIRDGLPPSYIDLDVRFLNRLRTGQLKPVDLGIWRQLGAGLEKPIFRLLEKNLYRKDHYTIGARKFTSRIGVLGRYNRAQLRRLYDRPFRMLVDLGFLAEMPEFQPSKLADDPEKIIFFPGPRARRKRKRRQGVLACQESPERVSEGQNEPNTHTPESDTDRLISRFMEKRHGIENPKATPAMRKAARSILDEASDFDEAAIAVDLAASDGREDARGFPKHLGGLLDSDYLEQARRYREKHREDQKRAEQRQRDEEKSRAEHQAYMAWFNEQIEALKATPEYEELLEPQFAKAKDLQRKFGKRWDDDMVQRSARTWLREELEKTRFSRARWRRELAGETPPA